MLVGLDISNINQKNGIGRVNRQIYKYLSVNKKIKKKFYSFKKLNFLNLFIFKILKQLWYNFIFPINLYTDNVNQFICHHRIPFLLLSNFLRKKLNITLILYDFTFIKYPHTMNIYTRLLDRLLVKSSIKLSNNIIVNSIPVKSELKKKL